MTTFFVFKGKGGNNVNKNRSNLVLSLVSLVITSFLLVFTVYSWYTSNQEVKASSIVGATDIEHTTFTLERWNESSSAWVNVSKIEQNNSLPGTTIYLRLKCVNENSFEIKLNAKFEGISSNLDTNFVKVNQSKISYNGVPRYDVVSNKVSVDPVTVGTTIKSVLYNISNSTITLGDFKIEDGYVIENFGSTETKTGAISSVDDITEDLKLLSDNILEGTTISTGTSYQYFALTYLDNDLLNNYFMYQKLSIDSLTISEA